jgi:hypothetical protein
VTTHAFPPALERSYAIVDGRIATRSLEAHVVDHCNLTCASCCSLSPFLPRWTLDPRDLARDLERARTALAPRVFKLVGGEPLLHPALEELVAVARRSAIAPKISLTTNGLLLTRTADLLWSSIDAMTISIYPRPSLDDAEIAEIEARAARFEVSLNWKHQGEFVVMDRETPCLDEAATRAIYDACWLRERCHMLRDGRFYACTRPPHMQSMHGVDFTGDGVSLDGGGDLAPRLLDYLARPEPLSACARCFGGNAKLVAHRLLTREELVRGRG